MLFELGIDALDPTAMAPARPVTLEERAPRAPAAPRAVEQAPAVDEQTLCARALAGEVDAWNALVAKHDHRVVVSLLARGVRIDRAKDLAQEAWMRLVEQQRAGRLTHLQLPGLAIAQAGFLSLEAARRDGARGEPVPLDGEGGARRSPWPIPAPTPKRAYSPPSASRAPKRCSRGARRRRAASSRSRTAAKD